MTLQDLQRYKSICQILVAIIETLNFFSINFIKNKNKFLGLAYGCRNYVSVLNIFDADRVFVFSFKKHAFVERVFTLMLVYRKYPMQMQEFFCVLQYLLARNSIDVTEDKLYRFDYGQKGSLTKSQYLHSLINNQLDMQDLKNN